VDDDLSAGQGAESSADVRSRRLLERLSVIQELAERLADSDDLVAVAEAINSVLRRDLGVSALTLSIIDQKRTSFEVLLAEGVTEPSRERLASPVPVDEWLPALHVLDEGSPIFWSTIAERDAEYPEFGGSESLAQSWAVLPLVARGGAVGVMALGWPEERRFEVLEATVLQVMAHQCAIAVDRARLEAVRTAERRTLELLGEGTRVMVSALDPARVIDELVRLAVPELALWCAVYVAEDRFLRRAKVEVAGSAELAEALRDREPVDIDDPVPIAAAWRTGEARVVPLDEAVAPAIHGKREAEHVLRPTARWMSLLAPIKASGEVLGVLSLVSDRWTAGPPDDVWFAAEGLAARAGVALLNARRFEEERRTAALLMRALLPEQVPELPGFDVAAEYRPVGARVAGDWYDVEQLPSGQYLVGIGDVGGHGIRAASLMGQLRNCARGFAVTGHSTSAVLEALHRVTADAGSDAFATAAYGLLDPMGHVVRWSSAGHLPPLLFGEGWAEYLDLPPSPPLGAVSGPPAEGTVTLGPGDGFVVVTDGVVERRRLGLEPGLRSLRHLVMTNGGLNAGALATRITEDLCGEAEDDCCILVVRRRPE
jgi:serine phosphatase RsbU (regulator of sigma subunit)